MSLFGTDGVRGKANTELTPELAMSLGRAAVKVLAVGQERPLFIIGRDTRVSGTMLVAAMASGLMSAGADVWDVGVLPTPALAYLTKAHAAVAGAMVSASHNPAIDNGIKFFSSEGFKLSDELEMQIEQALIGNSQPIRQPGDKVGVLTSRTELQGKYLQHLRRLVPDLNLRIVVDCANGAASDLAKELFAGLGCEVHYISCSPDGLNINVECGSTHINKLQEAVRALNAHAGFALDGDADRVIACNGLGEVVDGDSILAICATQMSQQGQLANRLAVGTIMSNYGLETALQNQGIGFVRSKVGDKYLLLEMQRTGAVLGAEQSGHCIFLQHGTTGDGLLTAVMLLGVMSQTGKSLAELGSIVKRYPQVLINVPVHDKASALTSEAVKEAMQRAEATLGDKGRLVVRPSGTENLVRVMVEANEETIAIDVATIVVEALKDTSA